jgi:hypothetical protein
MTIQTIKFSEFVNAGDLATGQTTVGVNGGLNALYNNPAPLLAPGTIAERPTPAPSMYYSLRFNTDLLLYEYYEPISMDWIQVSINGVSNFVNETNLSVIIIPGTSYAADSPLTITFTLPLLCAAGLEFEIVYKGSGGWTIAQNAGQSIDFSGDLTTTGVSGSISTTTNNGTIRCKCITDNTLWTVTSATGILDLI